MDYDSSRAPNFRGLWEAAVKSMKLLLRKQFGSKRNITAEDLYTIICQFENILNSRPITALSDDVKDPSAITPFMLLSGFNKATLPIMPQNPRIMH